MADQASGNNEVHIAAEAEADRRQDPAGDRRSAEADREGHLRRLPRLRRADCRGAAERDPVDARLHHLQGKAERVTRPRCRCSRSSTARSWRRCCATRPAPGWSASTTPTTPTSTSSTAKRRSCRGWRRRSPISAARCRRRRAPRSRDRPARAATRRRAMIEEDARDAQAFVDRWRPRVEAMTNARHASMLRVILGEDARAEAVLRAGAGRPHRPAGPPRRTVGPRAARAADPVDRVTVRRRARQQPRRPARPPRLRRRPPRQPPRQPHGLLLPRNRCRSASRAAAAVYLNAAAVGETRAAGAGAARRAAGDRARARPRAAATRTRRGRSIWI